MVGFDCQGVCGGSDWSCYDNSVGGEITSGCDLPNSNTTGYLYLSSHGDTTQVLYNSPYDIGGFQFNLDGASDTTSIDIFGGDAGDQGYTISGLYNQDNVYLVMGFSLSGATIPAGCGTLTTFMTNHPLSGLSALVISDPGAQSIYFEYFYEGTTDIAGCTNSSACNYDSFATSDDGSCQYLDCAGECGGSAEFDACGECGGSNECIHFTPGYLEYSDNPYLAMNIFVTSAELGDAGLEMGDEIGIFDGNACVGSAIITSSISVSNMLQIVASSQDDDWPDGIDFITGIP
jgi:hypothetical protein